ncbi:MAG: hypothetical protein Q9220_004965 [cf. Caloplaca sp. 1 TL-2023]
MPPGPKVYEFAHFDQSALCDLASSLREGQSCSCDPTQTPAKGASNWAIFIKFADGVEWVFRSPEKTHPINSPKEDDWKVSNETNSLLLASEAATLKYVKLNSTIPVPEVFAYSDTADNPIGVPYILMSKAVGTPLGHLWRLRLPSPEEPEKQRTKVLSQLGSITWQLSRLRFASAGSLFEEDGRFLVKQCLSAGLLMNQRDTLKSVPRGPFATELDYYVAHVEALRQHARFLPLYPHCLFALLPARSQYGTAQEYHLARRRRNDFAALMYKMESSQNMVDLTIAANMLPDMLRRWLHRNKEEGSSHKGFSLHHPDLTINNIFVDKDYNITGIIDWTFCSAVPLPVLLMLPGLPHSLDGLDRTHASEFASGFLRARMNSMPNDTSDHQAQMTELFSQARSIWLLMHFTSLYTIREFGFYKELWERIGPAEDLLDSFRAWHESQEYMSLQKEWTRFDRTPGQLARYEPKHFGNDIMRLAIARKLTLVSEWGERYKGPNHRILRKNAQIFVGDGRLWRWIAACLPEEDHSSKNVEPRITELASEKIESEKEPSPHPVAANDGSGGPEAEATAEKNKSIVKSKHRKHGSVRRVLYKLVGRDLE